MRPSVFLPGILILSMVCLQLTQPALGQAEVKAKIAKLEKQLEKSKTFDFALHNELRHLYGGIDEKKSMRQVEAILRHQPFDAYMKQILGATDSDRTRATLKLLALAKKHDDLPNLSATCITWAGDLESKPTFALRRYHEAMAIKDASPELKEAIQDRFLFRPPESQTLAREMDRTARHGESSRPLVRSCQ